MMRFPCFIAVDRGGLAKEPFEGGASIRPCTAGGWRIEIGPHVAYFLTVGTCALEGSERDVYCVLVIRGSQFKVFRYLEDLRWVVGPFDFSKLPSELEDLLIERSTVRDMDGNVVMSGYVRSPYLLAGEKVEDVDAMRVELGEDPNGSLGRVVKIAYF